MIWVLRVVTQDAHKAGTMYRYTQDAFAWSGLVCGFLSNFRNTVIPMTILNVVRSHPMWLRAWIACTSRKLRCNCPKRNITWLTAAWEILKIHPCWGSCTFIRGSLFIMHIGQFCVIKPIHPFPVTSSLEIITVHNLHKPLLIASHKFRTHVRM